MKKKTLIQYLPASTFAVALALMATAPAGAVNTDTWNGGGTPDGNWTTANNWGGTAPIAFDALLFDGNQQTLTTNNFSAGTYFDNLAFSGSADAFTLSGNALNLITYTNGIDGSTVTSVGGNITNGSPSPETISLPITLTAGKHSITTAGGGQLNLNGALTRNSGGVVVFNPANGPINLTGGLDTNGLNNILGGWATLGNDWATLDVNSNVVAYTGYTPIAAGAIVNAPTSNVKYASDTAVLTAANGTVINSLIAEQGGTARTLTIATAGTMKLGSRGGIFRDGLAGSVFTVTGGFLTAAGGGELTFSCAPFTTTGNNLAVNTVVSNDGPNVVSVNIMGYVQYGGGGANTYSGGTYINQGRVQVTPAGGFGTGPVYVFPGAQILFNANSTWTNSFYIGGVGSTESGGLGAFRMGGAGRTISGPVTLMGDACIANNGKISGPITGPGSLFIGHGSSANGHGVIQVGGAVPNDYAGDTVIGSAAQALDTLQINATFNNVMPHGAGRGNVLLNAGSATITATLDVNGTTQTINGLTNTSVSAANNFVTNSASATQGTLVVGDNNVTSSFSGRLVGYVGIKKIGTGTQTLTGANTYTGDTTAGGGSLLFTAGSSIGGSTNLIVNSNATLNISALCPMTLGATKTFTSSNGTTVVALQGTGNAVTTPTLNALGSSNYLTISQIPAISSYPAQFPAIKYTTLNGTLNFGLAGALPASPGAPYAGYVSNNVANGSVDFVVTAGPVSIKWAGNDGSVNNSAWDTSTTNWRLGGGGLTTYADGTFANFDDTALYSLVSLNQDVNPAGITVSNNVLTYTNIGGGKITGGGGLIKQGPGRLILDNNNANDFTGGITILGGTVQVGDNDSGGTLPTGGNINNNGNLTFARSDTVNDTSVISGTGTLTQNGNGLLNLAGVNTFTGAVTVAKGTLQIGNNAALGTTNGVTTIQNGATLDIPANAINLGQERIIVSGPGVGGGGALSSSSGSLTFVGPNAARVTMVGDTTVGGSGRFDLRSVTTGDSSLSSLSTGGQPYKLTKVGSGTFGLIGCTVDPQLGDIEIQQGILSVEAAMTTLGNASSNLFIRPGGTFQIFAATNLLNKVITIGSDGAINSVSASSGNSTIIGPMFITNDCYFNVNAAAVTLTLNNVLTGTGKITKIGAGTLTFAGNSPAYEGGFVVSAGSVALSGTMTNTLGATVNVGKFTLNGTLFGGGMTNGSGATIAGSGTNAGASDIFGILNPGDTNVTGTLTLSGLTLEGGATLNYDLAAATTPGGRTNDLIVVNGDLLVNGNSITINPLGLLKTGPGNPYRLFNYTGNLIVNGDLSVSGPSGYNFVVDTNTPGQVNVVVSGGPPIWNGGSVTGNNWTDSANWGGVTVSSGNTLFFAGTSRLNNTNDTSADTSYTDLAFNTDAGPFILNGNPVALAGNVINNSTNTQTINLGLDFSTSRLFNGGTNAGAAGLILGGGITNTAGLLTSTLAGNGILTNLIGCTDPNSMTNIISINSNSSWVLLDNPASAAISTPVQFDVLAGTFSFGSGTSAPNLNSTAAANNTRIGVAASVPATFNMMNGVLTLTARLNTGAAANSIANLNQSGGTLSVALMQSSDGSANALTTLNFTGGTFNVGVGGTPGNFFLASRGTGIVTVASSAVVNCGVFDISRNAAGNTSGSIGVVNLNGGVLNCTRVGTATGSAQTGPPTAGPVPAAAFNFNGGVLKAAASSTTFFQGNAASPAIPIVTVVKSGGAIIDTTNFNISVLEPLQHDSALGATPDGGLVKKGVGTLTLTAASTYTGNTVVSNGTLVVNGSLGLTTVMVATNATLAGTGSLGSNVLVNAGGTITAAGVGTLGALTVVSNVTLLGNAALDINANTLTNDVLKAGSIAYGGTLTVTNVAGTLVAGDSFKLFNSPNITGTFAATNLPALNPGLGWVTTNLANGILSIVATVNTTPTNLTTLVTGNLLTLSWPADHTGWRLQVQTNSLNSGLKTNWVDVAGSTTVNSVNATLDPVNGTVFYRMVYP